MEQSPRFFVLPLLVFTAHLSLAQKGVDVTSPDNRIRFELQLVRQSLEYSIRFNNQALIEHASLSLEFADGSFRENLKINKPTTQVLHETYDLILSQ